MAYTRRLTYETLRSVDTATAASYVVLGTPLVHQASIIKMVNLSNKNLLISIDGTNNHDVCPANGAWVYDVTANKPLEQIFAEIGRQYYVKTTDGAAGTGLVYLVVQYCVTN